MSKPKDFANNVLDDFDSSSFFVPQYSYESLFLADKYLDDNKIDTAIEFLKMSAESAQRGQPVAQLKLGSLLCNKNVYSTNTRTSLNPVTEKKIIDGTLGMLYLAKAATQTNRTDVSERAKNVLNETDSKFLKIEIDPNGKNTPLTKDDIILIVKAMGGENRLANKTSFFEKTSSIIGEVVRVSRSNLSKDDLNEIKDFLVKTIKNDGSPESIENHRSVKIIDELISEPTPTASLVERKPLAEQTSEKTK